MNNNKTGKWSTKKILLAAVVILLGWLIFFLFFNDFASEPGDINSGIYKPHITATEAPSPLPSPSLTPLKEESTVSELQLYLLSLIGNKTYSYGNVYEDIILKENMLNQLVNLSINGAEKISVEQVNTGDIALCGDTVGICVGRYNNSPVFAYISSLSTRILPDGGVYFGYSLANKDQSLCGLYPLPFSSYYDTNSGTDTGSGTALAEKNQES